MTFEDIITVFTEGALLFGASLPSIGVVGEEGAAAVSTKGAVLFGAFLPSIFGTGADHGKGLTAAFTPLANEKGWL